jgi:hypothetical protein
MAKDKWKETFKNERRKDRCSKALVMSNSQNDDILAARRYQQPDSEPQHIACSHPHAKSEGGGGKRGPNL